MSNLFYINEMPFPYADLSRGKNQVSERTVEVSLGNFFRTILPSTEVLEVGNVLHQYASSEDQRDWHTVVDLKEKFPHVTNADIREWRPDRTFSVIICLSTLEHVGDTPTDKTLAISMMSTYLRYGGVLLVTMPVGWRHDTNEVIARLHNTFDNSWYMVRNDAGWKEAKPFGPGHTRISAENLSGFPQYGERYKRANTLYIGVYRK